MPDKLIDLITISINRGALTESGLADSEKMRPAVCEQCPFYVFSTEWGVSHCILFGRDVEAEGAKMGIADFCKLDWLVIRYKGE